MSGFVVNLQEYQQLHSHLWINIIYTVCMCCLSFQKIELQSAEAQREDFVLLYNGSYHGFENFPAKNSEQHTQV